MSANAVPDDAADFDATLRILKELYDSDRLFITLLPPFTVVFEFDPAEVKPLLGQMTAPLFDDISNDIGVLLMAILDDVEEFVQRRLARDKNLDETELRRQIAATRLALWSAALQNRYHLKISSKAPAFAGIDWDIKVKVEDASLHSIDLPYTTCKIRLQREFDNSPFTVISGRVFDAVQINLTLDEVSYLIRVLTTVQRRLAELEGRDGRS